MKVLMIHQNFPGQYKHIAPALVAAGHQVVSLSMSETIPIPNVKSIRYIIPRQPTQGVDGVLGEFEAKRLRGEGALNACLKLKEQGFYPDVILVHPGWGEALFLDYAYPNCPQLHYCEFFYRVYNSDVDFDPEFSHLDAAHFSQLTLKNSHLLLSLQKMTLGVSPTAWQRQQFPIEEHARIQVIHEGIDTQLVSPNPHAEITIDNKRLAAGQEIITFVNRNLEPYRGFHIFMRALPEIMKNRPHAEVIIVGGNSVSYGSRLPNGQTYRDKMMREVGDQLDMSRVHFVGNIPYNAFLALLQTSALHIYLTYPFVLSWSMLEAMSAGCLVLGSATPPVKEVIRDEKNGLLVDFFSPEELAKRTCEILAHPERYHALREKARETIIQNYDLKTICLPKHLDLIQQTISLA